MPVSNTPIPEPAPGLDQRLGARMTRLHTGIAEVLDVDAGLRDARLPALHTDLARALEDVLDIDEGLRAIPPTRPSSPVHRVGTGPRRRVLRGPATRGAGVGSALSGTGGGSGGFYPPLAGAGVGPDHDVEHKNKYDEGLDLFDDLPPAYPSVFGE